MSRSGRPEMADNGLRRSSRQRRPVFKTLREDYIIDGYDAYLYPDEMPRRKNLRSASLRSSNSGGVTEQRESKPGSSRDRSHHLPTVQSREVLNLRMAVAADDPAESDTEEILDIYSRVKRRRRTSHRAYEIDPLQQEDSSNPSIVTESSDIVPPAPKRRQKPVVPTGVGNESSDGEEEETIRKVYELRKRDGAVNYAFPEPDLPDPKRRPYPMLKKKLRHRDESEEYRSRTTPVFQSSAHDRKEHKRILLSKKPSDSSSSTDSDPEVRFERRQVRSLERSRAKFLPFNLGSKDVQRSLVKNSAGSRHGASCADVDPMHIDSAIGFESVGGLNHHIYALKEMILLPMLYPDTFAKLNISPPRGVLFYGEPGTGKTLVARALANECSKNDKKVAFFMRKGADCLSKWVGESERQLRLLFDQAYTMRPSIIFFDEIDGLAPVRSSRQDQIHSSIVSTLLALMDGLDDRSEVVVIGATNRLDSIDPALRRPGRFDRELRFTMPDKEARKKILNIHTKAWQPPLSEDLLGRVADQAVGYGGADLKGLCTEAALIALRKNFPQIYATDQRLALDPNVIQVTEEDFTRAMKKQVPCSQRSLTAPVRASPTFMKPLISPIMDKAVDLIPSGFTKNIADAHNISDIHSVLSSLDESPPILGRRILLCGNSAENGQTQYIAPALLHFVDHLPIYSLAIPNLYSSTNRTPEDYIAETLKMASCGGPCVVFIPSIDSWSSVFSQTSWATLVACLRSWTVTTPVLILATADCAETEIDDETKQLLGRNGIIEIPEFYSDTQRRSFFEPLLLVESKKAPTDLNQKRFEDLPIAPPPPPRQLTEEELKEIRRQEESSFRDLRLFLRDISLRLFRDRKYAMFAKPVDAEQAPDYYEIVSTPMDLSTIMSKIDQHKYECVQEYLADIDLIRQNALEYNPDIDQPDKVIRHRACDLRDCAYALVDSELDWNFEAKLNEIKKARSERGEFGPVEAPPSYVYTVKTRAMANVEEMQVGDQLGVNQIGETSNPRTNSAHAAKNKAKAAEIVKKYRKTATRKLLKLKRGRKACTAVEKRKKSAANITAASGDDEIGDPSGKEENEIQDADSGEDKDEIGEKQGDSNDGVELPEPPKLDIDDQALQHLLKDVVRMTRDYSLVALESVYVEIETIVCGYSKLWDRRELVADIRKALKL